MFEFCIDKLTGLGSVFPDGAFGPWQRILKRLEEIEDAPADNDVIIEANKAADLQRQQKGEFI